MPSFASKPLWISRQPWQPDSNKLFVGARLPAKALGQAIPMAQKYCIRGQARSYKYGFGRLKQLR
jgi:hypothetical protein